MSALLVQLILLIHPFWPTSETGPNHNKIFDQITIDYNNHDYNRVKELARIALINSKKSGNKFEQGRSLFFLGAVADKENRPDQSIPFLLESLASFSEVSTNKSHSYQAEICISLGKIFRQHSAISEALEVYQQGIDHAKEASNSSAIRKLLYNQSVAFRKQGDLLEAMETLIQSQDYLKENDKSLKQRSYNQMGLIYGDLGEYTKARTWYEKMIHLDKNNPSRYSGQANHNIASTYMKQGDLAMAIQYYRAALLAFENTGKPKDFFLAYNDMAELALLEKKYDDANYFAEKALAFIDQVPNTPEYYAIYKLLAESLADRSPSNAMKYAQNYMERSESFNHIQKEMLANGDRYKVELIASTYFNDVRQEKEKLKFAWSMSCSAAFIFLIIALTSKLYRIYRYRSPKLALSHIKNHNEMIFLLDLFRKEKEEIRNTLKQSK